MAHVPEGQVIVVQARSAWLAMQSGPVPEGWLSRVNGDPRLPVASVLRKVFYFLPRVWKFVCYIRPSMAIQKKNAFSRRLPDLVTEELVTVLSQKKSFEFKQLFEIVHENLRQRNAASGGEEMLRLRAYEKLQNLVARGVVKKSGKIYKGDSSALAAMTAANTAQAAAVAASKVLSLKIPLCCRITYRSCCR